MYIYICIYIYIRIYIWMYVYIYIYINEWSNGFSPTGISTQMARLVKEQHVLGCPPTQEFEVPAHDVEPSVSPLCTPPCAALAQDCPAGSALVLAYLIISFVLKVAVSGKNPLCKKMQIQQSDNRQTPYPRKVLLAFPAHWSRLAGLSCPSLRHCTFHCSKCIFPSSGTPG